MSEDERPQDPPPGDGEAPEPTPPDPADWEPLTARLRRRGQLPEREAGAETSGIWQAALSAAKTVTVTGVPGSFRVEETPAGYSVTVTGGPATGVAERPPTVPDPFQDGRAPLQASLVTMSLMDAIHHGASRRDWDDGQGQTVPTHVTRVGKGGGAIYVSLRGADGAAVPPQDAIPFLWQKVDALGDLASDALCVCLALAEERERLGHHPAEPFWVTADRILDGRHVKRIARSGEPGNWTHGHRREDRLLAGQALGQLHDLWLQADVRLSREGSRQSKRLQVNSRALAITDLTSQQGIDGGAVFLSARVVFGEWASAYWEHGLRQTAILSRMALEYDPYRQQVEKRLAKYLAFQFKVDAKHGRPRLPCVVETLLRQADLEPDPGRPQRVLARLEKALNRLHADGVIARWDYADAEAIHGLPARGWLDRWLRQSVLITLPDDLYAHYQRGRLGPQPRPPRPAASAGEGPGRGAPGCMRPRRLLRHRGWTATPSWLDCYAIVAERNLVGGLSGVSEDSWGRAGPTGPPRATR